MCAVEHVPAFSASVSTLSHPTHTPDARFDPNCVHMLLCIDLTSIFAFVLYINETVTKNVDKTRLVSCSQPGASI